MAWLLLTLTSVLALLVVLVAVLTVRVRRLERRLAAPTPSSDASGVPERQIDMPFASLDAASEPEIDFVITHLGEEPEQEPAPVVEARLFADIVLRETVVQAAGLVHGLRRALAPEVRNRIRFEMRREIKRSRKQRRADLRAARRAWEAQQRSALPVDDLPEDTAA